MTFRALLVAAVGVVFVAVGLTAVFGGGGSSVVPVDRVVLEAPASAALPDHGVEHPVDAGIAELPERRPDREEPTAGGDAATDSPVDDQQLEALGVRLAARGWTVELERLRTVVTVRSDLADPEELVALCGDSVAALLDLVGGEQSLLVRVVTPSLERDAAGLVGVGRGCSLMGPLEE